MLDLGTELREAREEKGISLGEAEAATRIKERYLRALEANDWAALPTEVQARGFLRNYAVYLGLAEDHVLSQYGRAARSAVVSLPIPPAADSPVPTTSEDGAVFRPRDIDIERMSGLPAWLSSDIFIGVGLALLVALAGFIFLTLFLGNESEPAGDESASPRATQSGPQATLRGEISPPDATAVPVTPTFDASIGNVQLNLEATEHVWVRVTVDGVQVLEGILAPNTPQTWQGTQQIVLETANGAGLAAEVNGQPQESLGERGEAVVLVWGPNGLLSPPSNTAP
jgi:cytoskeletal protein RodZ